MIATLSSKTNGPRVEFSKAKIAVATTTASPLPPIRDVSMLPCFIGSIPCTYLPTCNAARPSNYLAILVWEHAHIQRPILRKTWARFHPATFVLKFQLGNHMVVGMSRESCPVSRGPSRGDFSSTPVSSKDGPLWTLDNFLVTCPLVFTNKISKEKLLGGTAGVFSNWLTFGSIPKGRDECEERAPPGKDDGRSHKARAARNLGARGGGGCSVQLAHHQCRGSPSPPPTPPRCARSSRHSRQNIFKEICMFITIGPMKKL